MMVGKEQTMKTLTHEQLRQQCPAIFQETPDRKVSTKYGLVRTIDVIDQAQKQGWNPINCYGGGQDAQGMHYVTMISKDLKLASGLDMTMTIVNSHDRTKRCTLLKGAYRSVCNNSLIMNPKFFGGKIASKNGFAFVHLINNVTNIPTVLDEYVKSLEDTQRQVMASAQVEWSETKQIEFASKSAALRGSIKDVVLGTILKAVRPDDEGKQAWKTFNRVQEHLINGGYEKTITNKGKSGALVPYTIVMPPVTNAKRKLDINMKLWGLYEQFTEEATK